jgi:hypothetical protein
VVARRFLGVFYRVVKSDIPVKLAKMLRRIWTFLAPLVSSYNHLLFVIIMSSIVHGFCFVTTEAVEVKL